VNITPVILAGQHVRLEPLTLAHTAPLIAAASDGDLWNSTVTIIPNADGMAAYIQAALDGQAQQRELAFVIIRKSESATNGGALARPSGRAQVPGENEIVGTTRFYDIFPADRKCAIGYTWLAKSAQRTPVNTETKLLLLSHAFEHWHCVRVELITDVLNQQSRAAILRLGAKEEGVLRNHLILPSGPIRDSVVFSIIDSEWPDVKARLEERLALHREAVTESSRG
jgi:RimJ/RimL family protein N-acetyltransferase